MKKLLILAILGISIVGAAGCRVADCWKAAWNSRRCEQNTTPCVVVDSCDPCEGGETIVTTPVSSGCNCGR